VVNAQGTRTVMIFVLDTFCKKTIGSQFIYNHKFYAIPGYIQKTTPVPAPIQQANIIVYEDFSRLQD
jgi:hypothetical protein